jgi:hypothetical protein
VLQQPPEICPEHEPGAPVAECRRPHCPSGACMRTIPYERVRDAAVELLEQPAAVEEGPT